MTASIDSPSVSPSAPSQEPSPSLEPIGDSSPPVGGNGEWGTQISSLPSELRDNPHISKHIDLASLAKDHVNAQGMIGRKGVVLPNTEDISDVGRFLTELGRPETPSDYVRPEGQESEALGVTADFRDNIDSILHEAGLTQEQYNRIVPGWAELVDRQQDALIEGHQRNAVEQIESLKQEFGAAYGPKMAAGERALVSVFGDQANDILDIQLSDGTLLGNNSDFVRGLIRMGEDHYVDDGLVDTRGVRVGGPMTPETAKAEIEKLMATSDFTDQYFDKNHAGHKEANSKMEGLYMMAHPPGERS